MNSTPIRVLVVDDHHGVRDGLTLTLSVVDVYKATGAGWVAQAEALAQ